MGLGPIHCGSFLLLAATVLLIVSSISSPVVNKISFLNVNNGNLETTYGVFGYCRNVNAGNGGCSNSMLGYPTAVVDGSKQTLSKALILHPIAAGIAFLSFFVALCSDRLGFLFASLLAFLAFLVSLAAMIVDFVLFGLIKHEINNIRANPAHATFANAIWLTLAATVILIFAGFIVCFECFGSRRRTRADRNGAYAHNGYVGNQMGDSGMGLEKRRWWRRNRSNKNAY